MKIEDLLQLSAQELESLSDEKLKEIFAPYLPKIRKPLDNKTVRLAKALLEDEAQEKFDDLLARAEKLL